MIARYKFITLIKKYLYYKFNLKNISKNQKYYKVIDITKMIYILKLLKNLKRFNK